jgi:ribonuclease BN (tRNA processing enzyme)
VTEAVFLGTGNFLAPGRYWNSFVLDGTILVEPCPTALPHLRRCGLAAGDLEVIVISHFHPDHTFGWPFLLLEMIIAAQRDGAHPTYVVGPPGVEQFLRHMNELGSIPNVQAAAGRDLDLHFVEVDGTAQTAGSLHFRAVQVDHVPHLRCFGYLFERDGRTIGYTGDTTPCDGLRELAGASDVLVLECNGSHPGDAEISHMDEASVQALRAEFPDVPFVLTHLGDGLKLEGISGLIVPEDFDRLPL